MEYVFRRFPSTNPPLPVADEIHLREANPQGPRELALRALEQGLAAFVRGVGPIQRLVIKHDPTLDDMLAAAFVERLLAEQSLPEGAGEFARYAADVRAGLQVTELPLTDSLEGIYLAIRHQAGDDLSQPEARSRFLADWLRMAHRILLAAEGRRNPLTTPLFQDDPYSARARRFLGSDRNVYAHQDVPRGKRWRVRLPGGPGHTVGGLLLRQPKSVLWKYWARNDPAAPGGKGYLFLGVDEVPRHWVFSTDPKEKVQIHPLADALQQAELKNATTDAARAAVKNDPWFDGKRFDYTLVAAPHAGTNLSDEQVVNVVKAWTAGQPVGLGWKKPLLAGVTASLLIVVGICLLGGAWRSTPTGEPLSLFAALGAQEANGGRILDPPSEGEKGTAANTWTAGGLETIRRRGKDRALVIALQNYNKPWKSLQTPIHDARALKAVLERKYGFKVDLLIDPTPEELEKKLRYFIRFYKNSVEDDDQLFIFIAGHGDYDAELDMGCLIASDVRPTQKSLRIPFDFLRRLLTQVPCKHVFLVLDVCYGGTFSQEDTSKAGTVTDPDRAIAPDRYFYSRIKHRTRVCLSSAGKEVAPDGEGHSPFAAALIEVLWNHDQPGMLTLQRLFQRIEGFPTGRARPQLMPMETPYDRATDFFFIAGKETAALRVRTFALQLGPLGGLVAPSLLLASDFER